VYVLVDIVKGPLAKDEETLPVHEVILPTIEEEA
jgi:hypothetical protein